MEQIKTVFFLALLSVLFVFIGYYFGGPNGMLIAFLLAAGMNFYAYYYSDKHVLSSYNAVEITNRRHLIYQITQKLAYKANLPMPKVYIIPDDMPNAFATGRNHQHAAVAVTQGLMDLLNEKEIEGVIAHELSHVRHYDILIGTIAAVFAGAIAMIANMMQFSAMFGGNDRQNSNPLVMIILAIVLPLAAAIIQMTVSRSREYLADEGAAKLVGDASGLQSALSKLENYAKRGEIHNATEQTAHMFIINPFSGKDVKFSELFRTHPTTEDRIARLEELKSQL
ncbi:protease [Malaciobacter halophilus]|uniref:Protease HtpX homolog n=1 Tax=Malaciobacter halophilus TaxID=197482 RepID=A0A2N1J592_9BACT|nr:zinc metalloprotease HtpX [Malaciobacter halophilus]AXH10333.1 heat shock protein HtpX, M48 family peptidase [Malaciobacter halophilus]PKI81684.1 protease [Malaciobacter halophilus]